MFGKDERYAVPDPPSGVHPPVYPDVTSRSIQVNAVVFAIVSTATDLVAKVVTYPSRFGVKEMLVN